MKVGGHEIEISDRQKVFFPDSGLTKGDVADYYLQVAETMVPHMASYGDSMQRFPDGLAGEGFYNKDTPDYFPDWIKTIEFPKREGGSFQAPVVDQPATLVYMADQAVLTHHVYLSRVDDLERPDKVIYDLDPPEGTSDYAAVRQAALDLRDMLAELDLESWVQTTGSKGFHVVVPLRRDPGFDEVRAFAHDVARVLVRRKQDAYTLEQRKAKRAGRIFLDTPRNAYGATAVAPYSVRACPGATVAAPLDWGEVEAGASPRDWTIENIPRRLGQKDDPWARLQRHARSLNEARRRALASMLESLPPADEEKD